MASAANVHPLACIEAGATVGPNTMVWDGARIRAGAIVGDHCVIGRNAFVDAGVIVGDRCKLQNGATVYRGAVLGTGVFIGPYAVITNDRHPRAVSESGEPLRAGDWILRETRIGNGASICANATVVAGVSIGAGATVAAGGVAARDVPDGATVGGVPAKPLVPPPPPRGLHTRLASPDITEADAEAAARVIASRCVAQGARVAAFEAALAGDVLGSPDAHVVAVSSGTAALHVALLAAGVRPGDEVITTPLSFVATVNAILMAGALPVFADVDEGTYLMNARVVEEKITPRTAAILFVDLFGLAYPEIKALRGATAAAEARGQRIALIEDACQSIGAVDPFGTPAGLIGDIGVFSFYPTKNLGFGEGGAVVTTDAAVAALARSLRQHGVDEKGAFVRLGYNYRLTEPSALIGTRQLDRLAANTASRIQNAQRIGRAVASGADFQGAGLTAPRHANAPFSRSHVFHQLVLRAASSGSRRVVLDRLAAAGVETRIFYEQPLHRLPHVVAASPGGATRCPVAEAACATIFSVPCHPDTDVAAVLRALAPPPEAHGCVIVSQV